MTDERVRLAAWNNAVWCDAVCRAHGMAGRFTPEAWLNPRRTPPFYPDAVTLAADASADRILAGIDNSEGCSIKDSFAALDLTAAGFAVLFDAQWIHRPADLPPPATSTSWSAVTTPAGLRAWEDAWRGRNGPVDLFRAALLDDPAVLVLGLRAARAYVAGAIANRSDGAVGISNVFVRDGDVGEAWGGAVTAISRTWPGLPMVGYEDDATLLPAMKYGFSAAGPLRVWLR